MANVNESRCKKQSFHLQTHSVRETLALTHSLLFTSLSLRQEERSRGERSFPLFGENSQIETTLFSGSSSGREGGGGALVHVSLVSCLLSLCLSNAEQFTLLISHAYTEIDTQAGDAESVHVCMCLLLVRHNKDGETRTRTRK